MNKVYFFLIAFSVYLLTSCKGIKQFQNKNVSSDCKEFFTTMVEPLKRKDNNFLEFIILDDTKNKKSSYEDYSSRLISGLNEKRSECLQSFSKKDIENMLGRPNALRSKEFEWFYVFDFGNECPCLSCPPNNYYHSCNFLRFTFNEDAKLTGVFADPNTLGWK